MKTDISQDTNAIKRAIVKLKRPVDISCHITIRQQITETIYTVNGTEEQLQALEQLEFVESVERSKLLRLIE